MRQKRTQTKLIGRQAFRGIISPLLLGGSGMSATPEMMSAQYVNAVANILSQDNTFQPLTQPCPMTGAEGQICDLFPSLPFCAKRRLKESDPQCSALQSDKPECGLTENIKRICLSKDPNLLNQYGQFCNFKKVNGLCIDEFMQQEEEDIGRNRDKDAEEKRKQDEDAEAKRQADEREAEKRRQEEEKQKEADRIAQQQRNIELEAEWVRTRGCKFYDANTPQSTIDMAKARNVDWFTTSTPCQYAGAFKNAQPGNIIRVGGKDLKFVGWIPETNPNTEFFLPLRGN